jgi:hypothetical protein
VAAARAAARTAVTLTALARTGGGAAERSLRGAQRVRQDGRGAHNAGARAAAKRIADAPFGPRARVQLERHTAQMAVRAASALARRERTARCATAAAAAGAGGECTGRGKV